MSVAGPDLSWSLPGVFEVDAWRLPSGLYRRRVSGCQGIFELLWYEHLHAELIP